MDDDNKDEENIKDPTCPRCGLRSYDDVCQNCNTPIISKKEKEEEDDDNYNWREKYR